MVVIMAGCWGDDLTSPNNHGPKAELTWTQTHLGPYADNPRYTEVRGTVRNDSEYTATGLRVRFRLKEGGFIGSQYISQTTIPPNSGDVTIVARTQVSYLYVLNTYIEWD